MATKCVLPTLLKLLDSAGFLHTGLGKSQYALGPSGTLLQQNILNTWWEKMVVKTASSFPIYGQKIEPLEDFFPTILQLMNKTLPFSLTRLQRQTPATSTNCDTDKLINKEEETRLQFIHLCPPATASQSFDVVANDRKSWWSQYSSTSTNFILMTQPEEDGLSTLHIQYKFPWQQVTIETIHRYSPDRLEEIEQRTKKDCKFMNGKKSGYPSVIECSASLELAIAVFLVDAFTQVAPLDETETMRQVLHLHPALAPYKVGIIHDGTKVREIHEVAIYISRELQKSGLKILHTKSNTSNTEQQIIRNDEMGIPFSVIINDNTIETGTVGLRSRDTTIQETLAINKLTDYISRHVNFQPPS